MAKMSKAMNTALKSYAKTIKKNGWKAGEPLIKAGVKKFGSKFKKWASAVGTMLRAVELLNEKDEKK